MERKGKRADSNGPVQANGPAPALLDENLEKVRDILFGHQVRHLEARIETLEAQLVAVTNGISADLKANVTALEGKLASEAKRVDGRFRDEQDGRARDVAKLESKLVSSETLLRGEITHLEEQLAKTQKGLEKRISDEVKALREALSEAQSGANDALESLASELRDAKTDRLTLAALFRHVAGQLEGEG